MRKFIVFLALLALAIPSTAQAAMSYGASYYQNRILYIGSGDSATDPLYLFINEVETVLEGATLEGGTTLTFSTNGGTISNANNNRFEFTENSDTFGWIMGSNKIELASCSTGVDTLDFNDVDALEDIEIITFDNGQTFDGATDNTFEWNENSDELIWTFGSNTVTMSSGDVTVFDFGTIVLGFDQFKVNATTYTFPTADGTNGYQLTTNGSGTLSWAAAGAGAGNTLDQAYDQGGAGAGRTITAADGAVTITSTDADAAFMLSVTPTPGSSAATGGIQITSGANSTEDSLQIANSGSGYSISTDSDAFTVASDGDTTVTTIIVTGNDGVVLSNAEQITNAVNTEIRLYDAGNSEDLIFDMDAGSNIVGLKSGTSVNGLAMGDVDDLSGVGTIAFDAAAASITTTTSGDAQDLTVQVAGATNSSLIVKSSGTAADALQIVTTAGGIDITNGGAAGGEDIDIAGTLASVHVSSAEDVADAITLNASQGGIDITADGAADKDLDLVCTNGSTNISGGEAIANAVTIAAGAGGIDITSAATFDIDVTATGGKFLVVASENAANTIELQENGGASGAINIYANQGTGASATTEHDASIQLQSDDGGIGLYTTSDLLDAIRIETNGGGNETLTLSNVQGTSVTEGAAAIELVAAAGGVELRSTANLANNIALTSDGGATGSILIFNDQGTSATEGSASIQVLSDAGGINIKSNLNNSNAILLTSDGGTSGTIQIHNDQGQGASSIKIISDDGGIDIDGGANGDIDITSTGKSISLTATEAAADGIKLTAATGAGGITIDAGTAGITFSDDSVTNVGDIACDDITADASTDIILSAVKTVIKSIDVDDDASTDDFQFDDDAANQNEQTIDCGAIVPAYAEILSCQLRCFETVTGSAAMSIDVGTSSGGNEILAAANTDSANDINSTGAGDGPEVVATNAARNVYVNATPGVNWNTLDAGRWVIMVTYVDYGATYTQKSP